MFHELLPAWMSTLPGWVVGGSWDEGIEGARRHHAQFAQSDAEVVHYEWNDGSWEQAIRRVEQHHARQEEARSDGASVEEELAAPDVERPHATTSNASPFERTAPGQTSSWRRHGGPEVHPLDPDAALHERSPT